MIALVAPSGPISEPQFFEALSLGRALGLPLESQAPFQKHAELPWLAGADSERFQKLVSAFQSAEKLWMLRGGYGAARLLGAYPEELKAAWTKPLFGFSDGTALLAFAYTHGLPAYSAPPFLQLPRLSDASKTRLRAALEGQATAAFLGLSPLPGMSRHPACLEGPFLAANLTVLSSLIGTPHFPKLDHAILAIEDVNEPSYKIDRMLQQLLDSASLRGLSALLLGDFTGNPQEKHFLALMEDFQKRSQIPVFRGLPLGHANDNASFPIGKTALLLGEKGELHFA